MAKCPICGEEIDELKYVAEEIHEYVFYIDNTMPDEVRYEETDMWTGDWQIWKCPLCGAELFYNEQEAVEFLKPKAKQTTLSVEG
jgi:predicted RNA-binding Zn-ribbon protein involved in translation (DUF1610 family)